MEKIKVTKVLNLYAGIGGNRKLWEDCEITAVELNEQIAAMQRHRVKSTSLSTVEKLIKCYNVG